MDKNTNYFQVNNSGEGFILTDRIQFNWLEIIKYPLPLTIGLILFLKPTPVLGIFLGLGLGLFYLIFRAFAWFFYKELTIDKNKRTVRLNHKFLDKTYGADLIDKDFKLEKIKFIKIEQSGKTKFLLRYETYKVNDILIIKSENQMETIKSALVGI